MKAYTEYLEDVANELGSKGDVKKMAKDEIEFERKLAKVNHGINIAYLIDKKVA